jgi:arsenate reductase
MSERTVLFVCLHGAAKSAMAAAQFERLAGERGVAARADFAGTEPDPEMAPRVVKELLAEGTDLRGQKPRRVTAEEARAAWRVVSFGCDLASIAPGVRVERWDDVPAVSDGYEVARDAIAARVETLLAECG